MIASGASTMPASSLAPKKDHENAETNATNNKLLVFLLATVNFHACDNLSD